MFASAVAPENKRSKLRRDLLLDYERGVHPVLSHTDNVTVELGMALIHLDLDERTSILEVSVHYFLHVLFGT